MRNNIIDINDFNNMLRDFDPGDYIVVFDSRYNDSMRDNTWVHHDYEILSITPSEMIWLNDWYEGQQLIRPHYILSINTLLDMALSKAVFIEEVNNE